MPSTRSFISRSKPATTACTKTSTATESASPASDITLTKEMKLRRERA